MKRSAALIAGALAGCLCTANLTVSAELLGDADSDIVITATDAAQVLLEAASLGAGQGSILTEAQRAAADVDADGNVSAADAAVILRYCAYAGTGGTLNFETYATSDVRTMDAVYLGVLNYGKSATKLANAYQFQHRFLVDGEEVLYKLDNTEVDAEGEPVYPLQNQLKENYHFTITVMDQTVIEVRETETGLPTYTPPISGAPGERTLRNLLTCAMEPVGTTVYMFGGGWNWQDTGGGPSSQIIGVSPDWRRFWEEHDANYTYRVDSNPTGSYYPFGGFNEYWYAGLDCSGFVSWSVYNALQATPGQPSYGGKSTYMAQRYAGYGWGTWEHSFKTPTGSAETAFHPGDIMSMKGHVWLSLGTCSDGSIVIAHSTPSPSVTGKLGGGVQIGAVGNSQNCEAYKLADHYMHTYYPEWCSRYRTTLKSPGDYLAVKDAACGRFRWDTENGILSDPDGIGNMSANDALKLIFGE